MTVDWSAYFTKTDLVNRGWNKRIIHLLMPEPDQIIPSKHPYKRSTSLYKTTRVRELEETEKFKTEIKKFSAYRKGADSAYERRLQGRQERQDDE